MSRILKSCVTVFPRYQDQYLFLFRSDQATVDAGRVNGVGGKVKPKENFVQAAVRETNEETGYKLSAHDFQFHGFLRTCNGYEVDWLVAFFTAQVASNHIPIGRNCPEGKLKWLTVDQLFQQKQDLVDDLHYLFRIIDQGQQQFFGTAQLSSREKVVDMNLTCLDKT